jgi:hypothetical protein
MERFNTFENCTEAILIDEAAGDMLNAVQSAMKQMSPGSNLFNGPGVITDKYDTNKNYYPNIRSGFAGLINKKEDDAIQIFINRISQLKNIDTWNPNANFPPELNGIVSLQYSQDFIPAAEKEVTDAITKLKESYERLPHNNELEKEFIEIINTDISSLTPKEYSKLRSTKSRLIRKLTDILNPQRNPHYNEMIMLQKAHIQSFITEFEMAINKWYLISTSVGSLKGDNGTNKQVDTADQRIEGTLLRNDITVYRDQWVNFLNTLQNAIVGSGQQQFAKGANVYSILQGRRPAQHDRKGALEYKTAKTLSPDILKKFHEKIMIPLFMKKPNNVLIYCTREQWDSISQGGRLYKAGTFTGKQVFTAGQNTPKVSL